MLIAHQFYEYNFPFQFNEYFLYWEKTYHFEVKTQVIQLLVQTTIKKKLDVQQFMEPFDKLSNARKTTKKYITGWVMNDLQYQKFIDNNNII